MVSHIKTTLNISDPVMRRVKSEAARRGVTMSALIEAALRRYLDDPPAEVELRPLPVFQAGELLVDVADRGALYEAMGGR